MAFDARDPGASYRERQRKHSPPRQNCPLLIGKAAKLVRSRGSTPRKLPGPRYCYPWTSKAYTRFSHSKDNGIDGF
jgi:hypothetical protein